MNTEGTTPSETTSETTHDTATATRTIAAPPAAVFAVLADPYRHPATEPGDWVHAAVDAQPITGVGDVFVIDMRMPQNGKPYVMHNLVIAFEPDRAIAWRPGQPDEDGTLGFGGWTWGYELEPVDTGGAGGDDTGGAGADDTGGSDGTVTRVTLTYDWSQVPQPLREEFGGVWPPFPRSYLDDSLAALDRAVTF